MPYGAFTKSTDIQLYITLLEQAQIHYVRFINFVIENRTSPFLIYNEVERLKEVVGPIEGQLNHLRERSRDPDSI